MRMNNGKEPLQGADSEGNPGHHLAEHSDGQEPAMCHSQTATNAVDLETIDLLNEELRRAHAELAECRGRLQASEARLRTVLESATEYAIITIDPHGHVTGWNAGAHNILGWPADEALGRDLAFLFTPEDREQGIPQCEMQTARQEGRAEDDRWHVHKDGRRLWARGVVTPLGESGTQGFLKILRDRTDEQAAAEAVERTKRRTDAILDCVTDAFVALDRDYRIIDQNRQTERINGAPLPTVLGKTAWEVWPASVGSPLEAALRRAMDERVPVGLEHHYRDDRGNTWLEFRIQPIPEGVGVCYRDITFRRRAEEELRASHERTEEILESISDAFYAVDHEWRFTYINRQAERSAGQRREDLLGKVFWEVFPQAVGGAPHQAYLQAARERRPVRVEALSPILGHWVDISIYPSATGLSVYFRDLSERKHTEEALRQAKKDAEQANASKSKFLAAASHDLRQPMQSLLLFLEVLKPHVAAKGQEALKHLGRGLDALRDLLDGLLDISRLDAGIVQPVTTDFPIRELLEQAGVAYGPIAAAKGLKLQVDACPAVVRSDRTLLGRMLRNLIENALRYTETGRINIACDDADGWLRLEVQDTGIGIAPEHLECIWDEFHQVGNPERDRTQGLGLGLSIVQRLSTLLHHPVQVRSTPGVGSVFWIEVPLGQAASVPAERSATEIRGNGQLAVLVDDDPIVLLGLKAIFEAWGYTVLAAGSADQALAELRERGQPPTLVVADYRLREGQRGSEAIVAIRAASGTAVPGVILTGETGTEVQREAAGHQLGVVHKPVTPRQLADALGQLLAGR